jgi:hypothetical protein
VQKWEYYWVLAHLQGGIIALTEAERIARYGYVFEQEMKRQAELGRHAGVKPEPKIEPEPELTVLAINGKRPKESLSMYVLANELGEQGWELVNIEHTTRGQQVVSMWVFKRSKPENR